MNRFPDFESFINEGDATYEKGCAMIFFDYQDSHKILTVINKNDLYEDDTNRYGIEDEPHVTLLYGLNADVPKKDVFDILNKYTINSIELTGVSLFENDKYDVLKWDTNEEILYKINSELITLPHENDFPDYSPHCTIAYIKPGLGKKYVDILSKLNLTRTVYPHSYVYSTPDGDRHIISL